MLNGNKGFISWLWEIPEHRNFPLYFVTIAGIILSIVLLVPSASAACPTHQGTIYNNETCPFSSCGVNVWSAGGTCGSQVYGACIGRGQSLGISSYVGYEGRVVAFMDSGCPMPGGAIGYTASVIVDANPPAPTPTPTPTPAPACYFYVGDTAQSSWYTGYWVSPSGVKWGSATPVLNEAGTWTWYDMFGGHSTFDVCAASLKPTITPTPAPTIAPTVIPTVIPVPTWNPIIPAPAGRTPITVGTIATLPTGSLTVVNKTVYSGTIASNPVIGNISAPYLNFVDSVGGTFENLIKVIVGFVTMPLSWISGSINAINTQFGNIALTFISLSQVVLAVACKLIDTLPTLLISLVTAYLAWDVIKLALDGD